MGNADLHIHTRHGDGMATVPQVLRFVEDHTTLDVIAVTEHDTLRAADEARDLHARGAFRFDVVPGMEVTTLDGHLLALYVDDPVPSFRRIEETLAAIHRAGGLAVAPHPLSWLTRSVSERVFDRVAVVQNDGVHFDGIEEYNMSPAGRVTSANARRLNRDRLRLAPIGSSDAHFLESIACANTEFEGTTGHDLRRAIESKTTSAACGRAPRLAELGFRNVALQQWRGMMATPRNMGWAPTIRSFVTSRLPDRAGARTAANSPADEKSSLPLPSSSFTSGSGKIARDAAESDQ